MRLHTYIYYSISCEELNKIHNVNCKRLVKDYMEEKLNLEDLNANFAGKEEKNGKRGEGGADKGGKSGTGERGEGLTIGGGKSGTGERGKDGAVEGGKIGNSEGGKSRAVEGGESGICEDRDKRTSEYSQSNDNYFESPDSICQPTQPSGKQIKGPLISFIFKYIEKKFIILNN